MRNRAMRSGSGVGEWFRGINIERIFFAIHRLTGLYLVLYIFPRPYLVLLHGSWEAALQYDMTPLGRILAILFIFSIAFHGINGLRILLIELGVISGRPIRDPIKPVPALQTSKLNIALIYITIVAAIIATLAGAYLVTYGKEILELGP